MNNMNTNLNSNLIDSLCTSWLNYKHSEDIAKAKRHEIEQKLITALGFDKPEGSQTFQLKKYKATLKSGFNRTLDIKKWEQIEAKIPDGFRPVKYKPELDTIGIKYLEAKYPTLYAIASLAITTKPAKISVSILEKEME